MRDLFGYARMHDPLETKNLLGEGAKTYGRAVAQMRKYLTEQDPQFIEEGLELARQADEQLAGLDRLTGTQKSE